MGALIIAVVAGALALAGTRGASSHGSRGTPAEAALYDSTTAQFQRAIAEHEAMVRQARLAMLSNEARVVERQRDSLATLLDGKRAELARQRAIEAGAAGDSTRAVEREPRAPTAPAVPPVRPD